MLLFCFKCEKPPYVVHFYTCYFLRFVLALLRPLALVHQGRFKGQQA
jgi:hypothetical protein